MEDMTIGDNFLTFLDDNSSVVFKGVIDPNGTFLIDPSFVNILLDRSQTQTQPQGFLETANGMTIQMIQMPPAFSLGGKSEKLVYTTDLREKQTFQVQAESEAFASCDLSSTNLPTRGDVDNNTTNMSLPYSTQSPTVGPTGITISEAPRNGPDTQTLSRAVEPAEVIEPPIGRDSFQCSICLKSFQSYQQFRKHKTNHLDDKPFRCEDCAVEFNFEMNLKLHRMVHEAEKSGNLHCQVCLAKFSRLASLKSHLRVHEKEENLVCNECGEEVPTVAKLNEHMEEHRTRVQQCMLYRCKLCGKAFNSQALLRDHSKGHAAVRKELKVFARQKPRSKAKQKTNTESSTWNSANNRKKKRVCSVCSKGFDKPSQLERHFRVHSGEKPFQCSYPACNKCFNQKVTLESHVLACHQGLKPFKCHLCNICFSQRGNLKSHIVKVHIPSGENERVFKCQECACVYRRLATLNHHISRIHAVMSSDLPQHSGTTPQAPPPKQTIQDQCATPDTVVAAALPSASDTPLDGSHPLVEALDQPPDVQKVTTFPDDAGEVQVAPVEATVQEVNCVYGDSHVTPRRCLLKVKKVGQLKFHLCPACPKSFRKPSDLIRHIRVHTLERPYLCTICTKSFAVKSTLNTHMKTHDPVKRLSCSVCLKKFSVLASLKSHERLHTGAKPFQCMQCGKQFRTSSQRRVHQKTHARSALGLTGRRKLLRIGEIKSNFKLPDPLKITSDGLVPVPNRTIKTTLDGLPVDQRSRPYRCNHADCTATFKKSSHLKQHHLSHTGERPYKCLQCHRNFISSGVLKNHIKTHEGVRAYSCKECNFAFTTNGSLKRHMATHLHERLFVCPYCGRTFKTSVATRKHIKVHRNEIVPLHTSYTALENPKSVIMQVDQQSTSAEEDPQQFRDVQNLEPSGMNSLYQNGYSDMSQVLGNNLNLPMASTERCCLDTETEPQLLPPISSPDEHLTEGISMHCQGSKIIHHSDSTLLLEYALPDSEINAQEDPSENLDQDNNFDSEIFALQQGESLDLQFLQDSQGIGNDSQNCLNQMTSYDFQSQPMHVSEQSVLESLPTPAETMECVQDAPLNPNPGYPRANLSSKKKFSASSLKKTEARKLKAKESVEVRKLREVSRPISEQLYTELATQPYQRRPKERPTVPSLLLDEGAGNKDCPICHTKFKKKSDMDRHLRIHTGEKPYRCGVCGKSFRVKSTRQAHMRTHEEKKKTVSCHVCQNLFSTKSSLRVHLRLHLDLKPYQCPFPNCPRNFRTSGHRKSHIQSHFKQTSQFGTIAGTPNGPIPSSSGTSGQETDFLTSAQRDREAQTALPPVQTIKENQSDNLRQGQELPGLHTIIETENSAPQDNTIHVLGGVQLQLEGLQFASLDLSSLQVDESFLQGVTNVIFLPASSSQGTTAQLLNGSNMVIGMLPTGQEVSSDMLSGKDILSSLSLLGSTGGLTAEQLSSGQVTLSDPNIHQYIINNNEMMSSTARPSSSNIPANQSQTYILSSSDFLCPTCQLPFPTKQQLQKHEKTHNPPPPKSFKCSICYRTFTQNASLQAHLKAHSKEKKEFQCTLCPYNTQRKPNFKTHFGRAHPDNWAQFKQVVNNNSGKEGMTATTASKVVA